MTNILVIGGGFAGVWAAAGAVRTAREAGDAGSEIRVTLVSGGDDLVVRPRLYEDKPERMRVALDRILGPIGVKRITATVVGIDTDARTVEAVERSGAPVSLSYDKLVLATGSQLIRPNFAGSENIFDVDTMPSAAALDNHLRRLPEQAPSEGRYTAVVVGAGFTGLEIATGIGERLQAIADGDGPSESVRVVLVDRADVIGPELGSGPRSHIEGALSELKVETRLDRTVASATADEVTLSDGEVISASTIVWTAGMAASPLTADVPGERDRLGRLNVDAYLRVTGVPDVYAAGDVAMGLAEEGNLTAQSCQHALPMGKFAGHNVVADVVGAEPLSFTPDPYTTTLDLGPAGAVSTVGWERTVRIVGDEAKSLKQDINSVWIYPPVDDAEQLLAQAGRFSNL